VSLYYHLRLEISSLNHNPLGLPFKYGGHGHRSFRPRAMSVTATCLNNVPDEVERQAEEFDYLEKAALQGNILGGL
jgi:hypothetical protein